MYKNLQFGKKDNKAIKNENKVSTNNEKIKKNIEFLPFFEIFVNLKFQSAINKNGINLCLIIKIIIILVNKWELVKEFFKYITGIV